MSLREKIEHHDVCSNAWMKPFFKSTLVAADEILRHDEYCWFAGKLGKFKV